MKPPASAPHFTFFSPLNSRPSLESRLGTNLPTIPARMLPSSNREKDGLSLREVKRELVPCLPTEISGAHCSLLCALPSNFGPTKPAAPTLRYQFPDQKYLPSPADAI